MVKRQIKTSRDERGNFSAKVERIFHRKNSKKKKKKQIRGNLVISKGNGDTDDRRKREIN